MEFTTDMFLLDKPSSVTFNLVGTRLPNNHDFFAQNKKSLSNSIQRLVYF